MTTIKGGAKAGRRIIEDKMSARIEGPERRLELAAGEPGGRMQAGGRCHHCEKTAGQGGEAAAARRESDVRSSINYAASPRLTPLARGAYGPASLMWGTYLKDQTA